MLSKYLNLYRNLLWPYDEGYQGVVVLGITQDSLKQFLMKFLFRKKKLYYKVKLLMVNSITRSMFMFV